MKHISYFENQENCLGCGEKITEIGAMAPRLDLFICPVCLIKLGPLEDHYFQILTIMADEIIKLRKKYDTIYVAPKKHAMTHFQSTLGKIPNRKKG